MILFFYNLALISVLLCGLPWWIFRAITTHKYREGMLERLGKAPHLDEGRPRIWLHAVSVGEVLAASRLVSEIEKNFPAYQVVISTTTLTGQKLACERFGARRVFYCPLDFPWAIRSFLNAVQPQMLILTETEFWPNLLHGCFRRHIPVVVVNARISDRSWPRYLRFRALWKPFLSTISCVLAQSQTDADRLRAIGCAEDRVTVAGNLKFDVRAVQEAKATRLLCSAAGDMRFLVAGSTLEGEESALLEAWPALLASDPNFVLVLAPRHPERFASVAMLLNQSGIRWTPRSTWTGTSWTETSSVPLQPGQIVLLDTIGELASIYSLASVAFVGGSLIPAGGHNPLEPAQFAVPIVMGPNYENFRAIVDDLLAHQALRIATKEKLAATILELCNDKEIGLRAKAVFEAQAGATERCIHAIQELVGQEPSA